MYTENIYSFRLCQFGQICFTQQAIRDTGALVYWDLDVYMSHWESIAFLYLISVVYFLPQALTHNYCWGSTLAAGYCEDEAPNLDPCLHCSPQDGTACLQHIIQTYAPTRVLRSATSDPVVDPPCGISPTSLLNGGMISSLTHLHTSLSWQSFCRNLTTHFFKLCLS